MAVIVGTSIEQYLYELLPERDAVLKIMEAEAQKRNIPIVGPAVARFLHQLALLHKTKRIFEMGSAIGYSTMWWAKAAGPNGEVHYTDGSADNAKEALEYFKKAGVDKTIKIHTGNALEILDRVEGEFDLIFCDIDKGDYPKAFKKALPRLRAGGLFVADNVLWHGTVAEPGGDDWTKAIREFNRLIYESPKLFTTIIPMRDGISISLKEA